MGRPVPLREGTKMYAKPREDWDPSIFFVKPLGLCWPFGDGLYDPFYGDFGVGLGLGLQPWLSLHSTNPSSMGLIYENLGAPEIFSGSPLDQGFWMFLFFFPVMGEIPPARFRHWSAISSVAWPRSSAAGWFWILGLQWALCIIMSYIYIHYIYNMSIYI